LYLNNGRWNGNQIISEKWVKKSTTAYVYIEGYADYGYQWWVDRDFYFAEGYDGQFIYVLEDLDMVIVFTAELYDSDVFHDLVAHIIAAGRDTCMHTVPL
jgi:CubicO group peptidase (beta-lactamase class C family)